MLNKWDRKKNFIIFIPQKFNKKVVGFLNIYNSYTYLPRKIINLN